MRRIDGGMVVAALGTVVLVMGVTGMLVAGVAALAMPVADSEAVPAANRICIDQPSSSGR